MVKKIAFTGKRIAKRKKQVPKVQRWAKKEKRKLKQESKIIYCYDSLIKRRVPHKLSGNIAVSLVSGQKRIVGKKDYESYIKGSRKEIETHKKRKVSKLNKNKIGIEIFKYLFDRPVSMMLLLKYLVVLVTTSLLSIGISELKYLDSFFQIYTTSFIILILFLIAGYISVYKSTGYCGIACMIAFCGVFNPLLFPISSYFFMIPFISHLFIKIFPSFRKRRS